MSNFNEREKAYEAKFARDEELRFKATSRRNRLLGAWAASQLGLSSAEADDYVKAVVRADFKEAGDNDVISKVADDFKAKGVALGEGDIEKKLIELMSEAVAQIEAGN